MLGIPNNNGQVVYSTNGQTTAYSEPSINKPKYANAKTFKDRGIFWPVDSSIGTYLGQSQIVAGERWYKLEYLIYAKVTFLPFGGYLRYSLTDEGSLYRPALDQAWFRGSEISTITTAEQQAIDDSQNDQDGNGIDDAIDEILNLEVDQGGNSSSIGSSLKSAFGSIFGPTIESASGSTSQKSATNGLIFLLTGILLVLAGLGLYRRNKKIKDAKRNRK